LKNQKTGSSSTIRSARKRGGVNKDDRIRSPVKKENWRGKTKKKGGRALYRKTTGFNGKQAAGLGG